MNRSTLSDHLHEVLADVRRLRERFADTAPREWEPTTAAAELTVQVGHVALCLLRRRGGVVSDWEDPARPISNIGDELADIVLAALSINVLAQREPTEHAPTTQGPIGEVDAFLRLLVAAGSLSEAALVEHDYRHRPTGTLPSLAAAAAAVIAACDGLADQLGLDLIAEFRSMVADANTFLDHRGDQP